MDHAEKAQMIEKAQIVAATKKRFEEANLVILTKNNGISVSQDSQFRKALRAEGGSVKVVKNTLAKLALQGTKFEGLADSFKGPIRIVTSADPVAAARVSHAFAKETNGKLEIVAGANTDGVMELAKVNYLATLPSLDGLRGKLVGLLQAPGAQLARLSNAYATKDQA